MDFLQKLDHLMEERAINKSKLSKISGVPYTTIDGFYKKGYENTKLSTIRKISEALNVSLDYLIDEGPEEKPSDGAKKELPTVSDEEHLDQEIIGRLVQLTPEELEKVDAFVQGLLAAR